MQVEAPTWLCSCFGLKIEEYPLLGIEENYYKIVVFAFILTITPSTSLGSCQSVYLFFRVLNHVSRMKPHSKRI